jgi:hypothetical protein
MFFASLVLLLLLFFFSTKKKKQDEKEIADLRAILISIINISVDIDPILLIPLLKKFPTEYLILRALSEKKSMNKSIQYELELVRIYYSQKEYYKAKEQASCIFNKIQENMRAVPVSPDSDSDND